MNAEPTCKHAHGQVPLIAEPSQDGGYGVVNRERERPLSGGGAGHENVIQPVHGHCVD